ncbi:MAG: SPOR domain-containing protein, partial [Marinilabiliaceae bacterium]|nr:SPOR domain-containing protein [Marinilabiliaceae bacterium]
THNDGLLITTLAQQENTSYQEAKTEAEQFAKRILKMTAQGETFVIDTVGELKQDTLGHLQFVANKSENFLSDAFGLTSFHFSPAVPIHRPAAPNKHVKRLLRPLSQKQIAATVALFFGLFIVSTEVQDPTANKQLNSASSISFLSHELNTAPKEAFTVDLPALEKESPVAEVMDTPIEKNIYFLIAGSFKKQDQAETFLKQVESLGEQEAFVLESKNHSFRVAINGYSDKTTAIDALNTYRKKAKFNTVWILTQR